MFEIKEKTLNRALVESFAKSASRLSVEGDTRVLKLRDESIAIDRIYTHDTPIAYIVSILDNNNISIPIDSKVFTHNISVESYVLNYVSSKYQLEGASLRELTKAIENVFHIKTCLYFIAFLKNHCDDKYSQQDRAIVDYDFDFGNITMNNVLDVTQKVFDNIYEKAYEELRKTPLDLLESVGLDYECIDEKDMPPWDYYGPHRHYCNEVDLPPICEKLLDKISSLFFNSPGRYEVASYDLSEYIFSCDSDEQLDMICKVLDCYTVFEGAEELYSV